VTENKISVSSIFKANTPSCGKHHGRPSSLRALSISLSGKMALGANRRRINDQP